MTNDREYIPIGFDAKRIVANGTGLGAYGRNLVNALAALRGATASYSMRPTRAAVTSARR